MCVCLRGDNAPTAANSLSLRERARGGAALADMGDEPPEVPLSDRVKVIKTDMEETMRDALMATVAEVFDKAKEKTSANKDIIYKDIATGTKPGRKSWPAVMHGAHRVRSACADGRLQPSWAALRCGRCVVWPSMLGNSLPTQASSRRSTSNTRRWTTRRRAVCTTASWAPTSPALSRTRPTSPATLPATTSA